jgi:phosphate transport system substrate-binding protein
MNGLKMKEAKTEDIAETMFDIIDVVSDYDNGAGAIGYSYYYYANTMYVKDDVKMIKVEGVEPNNETIKSEEYPIITAYYIVTRKDEEEGSSALKLRDAMLSARGQKVAEEAGYVPVK